MCFEGFAPETHEVEMGESNPQLLRLNMHLTSYDSQSSVNLTSFRGHSVDDYVSHWPTRAAINDALNDTLAGLVVVAPRSPDHHCTTLAGLVSTDSTWLSTLGRVSSVPWLSIWWPVDVVWSVPCDSALAGRGGVPQRRGRSVWRSPSVSPVRSSQRTVAGLVSAHADRLPVGWEPCA